MKIFNICDYGAHYSDRLQTEKIQKAIDDCFLAGGGRVLIPCGIYLTGSIRIRSGVELYLESGAILKGSRDPEDYFNYRNDTLEPVSLEPEGNTPQTGKSTVSTSRWSNALIRAFDAHDIAIIGEKGSYIDGSLCYDPMGENNCRGPHGIGIWRCKNIHLEGYTFINSSNWCHAIFKSQNITVRGVAVHGGFDGVDIRTCDDVVIEDCDFNCGDDAVAGYDNHNVIVRNCNLSTTCMPLRIGGNNFLVENCHSHVCRFGQRLQLPMEERILGNQTNASCRHEANAVFSYYCDFRAILRKSPENIVIKNCHFDGAKEVMRLEFTGVNRFCRQRALKEITFENCTIGGLDRTGMLWGDAEDKVICRFKNVTFTCKEGKGEVPLLAVANFEELLFEDCTFVGYDKPILLVASDDKVTLVRSGEMEFRPATLEECLIAHPGGKASTDQGKDVHYDLKDWRNDPQYQSKA